MPYSLPSSGSFASNPVGSGPIVTPTEQLKSVHQTKFTFTNQNVNMVDVGANGSQGSLELYDFPEGLVKVDGAVAAFSVVKGAGGIDPAASIVMGIGSIAALNNNATLTGTEANIVASNSAGLTAGVGTANMQSAASVYLDGTDTPAKAFLNFAVVDAGSSANDTLTITGTLIITWYSLGDN